MEKKPEFEIDRDVLRSYNRIGYEKSLEMGEFDVSFGKYRLK